MFEPRVALASLSGEADVSWACAVESHVGCAFLGGIALDEQTRDAARAMVDRDRSEFLPDDPVAFVDDQLASLVDAPLRPAFNVRSTTLGPVERTATVCQRHNAIIEINAHCRQNEMCAAGAGESLLREPDRLATFVEAAASTGATVSVKGRAELDGVSLPGVAQAIEEAGGDLFHVDAMDSESVIDEVTDATDLFVVANNGVRGAETAREYLSYGADAVSVGRASDRPAVLDEVRATTAEWFASEVSP
ncbi:MULTISPECIES: tRNA-dihydrouridine synthase [unclassified Haloarcula]|uniref:tRNA-dihydrouridine synthase n=1 Tax=unclassified Haloarcula TaxID=2624677 RepID=UPI000EF27C7F|nr:MULTISPECIES: tRNA-dihydrouridine synthase [unclassified Haloarcula]RLM36926.1 dihydropyrimidine dehydrogenase [Haloarcula sp. Atlit-120R]RLM44686.1 dihydropyrimidine dehydrogenase [Haloarcula sp. Atlit-47R]